MSPAVSRRHEILDAATRLASQMGLEGVSIGDVASALGMSKSGLYAHFESKRGLKRAILDHFADVFTATAVRPALQQPRGEPRFRALFEHWLAWHTDNPFGSGCLFVAAATELDDQPGPVRDRFVALQRDLFDLVANVARTGLDEGHFRPDVDPRQVAHELYGILLAYHYASRLIRDPQAERRARTAFARLLTSLRTAG